MNIIIRADSSFAIGSGHIARCIEIAKILTGFGAIVTFVSRNLFGNFSHLIIENGFNLIELQRPSYRGFKKKRENWLGVPLDLDAEETKSVIKNMKIDWIIVDNYGIDILWEIKISEVVKNIMVIDDLADRKHHCNILLDQNYVKSYDLRYKNLVPEKCKLLLGPNYALLNSIYFENKSMIKVFNRSQKKILVFFGGSDAQNLSLMAMDAVLDMSHKKIHCDVVISQSSKQYDDIIKKSDKSKCFRVHSNVPSLFELIKNADLAIGTGGVSLLERCSVGLPSIIITSADNQKESADALNEINAIKLIGHYNNIDKHDITSATQSLIFNEKELKKMSDSCKSVTKNWDRTKISTTLEKLFM